MAQITRTKDMNFSKYELNHPSYKMHRINQESSGTTMTIGTSGGDSSVFHYPVTLNNSARSAIGFVAQASTATAGNVNYFHVDGIPFFSRVEFIEPNGQDLANIQSCNRYTNMVSRHRTTLRECLTFDRPIPGSDNGGNSRPRLGFFEGLIPNNAAYTLTNLRWDGTNIKNVFEPLYVMSGGAIFNANAGANVANTATPYIDVRIRLSRFIDTVLALDKTIYWGKDMQLRLTWAPSTQMVFTGTNTAGSNPVTGAAAYTGNVSITDFYLYVATDMNLMNQNAMKSAVNDGLEILTPYVTMTSQGLAAASNHVVTVNVSSAGGNLKLLRMYYSVYDSAGAANTYYDHSCLPVMTGNVTTPTVDKLSSFFVTVEGVRTTDYDLNLLTGLDYDMMRPYLKGSCILSSNDYYYNWMYQIRWDAEKSIDEDFPNNIPDVNMIDGLDLTDGKNKQIQISSVTDGATALTHYIYAVTLRKIRITPNGVTFVPA